MTDWVDDFVSKLSDEQRQANTARAHALLSDRLITERGPAFFSQLVEEAKTQAEELNAKLGATIGDVTFRSEGDSFSIVAEGAQCKITVVVTSNLRSHQIEVMYQEDRLRTHRRRGAHVVSDCRLQARSPRRGVRRQEHATHAAGNRVRHPSRAVQARRPDSALDRYRLSHSHPRGQRGGDGAGPGRKLTGRVVRHDQRQRASATARTPAAIVAGRTPRTAAGAERTPGEAVGAPQR